MAPNKLLETKWRKFFAFADIDRDGYVTRRDYRLFADRIIKRTNSTGETARKTIEQWDAYFESLKPDPSVEQIDIEMFIKAIAKINEDVENQKKLAYIAYDLLFDNLDKNKDGLISLDELKMYYEGHGVKDEQFVEEVIEQLDTNKDGFIGRDEFIVAGVSYWT